jgi:hypothetical protein
MVDILRRLLYHQLSIINVPKLVMLKIALRMLTIPTQLILLPPRFAVLVRRIPIFSCCNLLHPAIPFEWKTVQKAAQLNAHTTTARHGFVKSRNLTVLAVSLR